MKINVPFMYTSNMIRKGHRVASHWNIVGHQEFDLKTLKKSEVHLAAQAQVHSNRDNFVVPYWSTANGLLKPMRILKDYGARYEEDMILPSNTIQESFELWENVCKGKGEFYCQEAYQPFMADKKVSTGRDVLGEEDVVGDDVILSTNKDDILSELSRAVARSAVINGVICSPSGGPCWTVYMTGYARDRYPSLFAETERLQAKLKQGWRLFAAHQAGEAAQYYNVLRNRARLADEEGVTRDIRIIMPEVFSPNYEGDRGYKLVEASHKFMKSLASNLPQMRASDIRLYADLKDAISLAETDNRVEPEVQRQILHLALQINEGFALLDNPKSHLGKNHPLTPFLGIMNQKAQEIDMDDGLALSEEDVELEDISSFKMR